MKVKPHLNKAWLLSTARIVAQRLKENCDGTRIRIRVPHSAATTKTDGWSADLGNLGTNQPKLEIWFDRFSGHAERKLCACFYSSHKPQIKSITKCVARKLWPVRKISNDDTNINEKRNWVLNKRLSHSEFNAPILEEYKEGWNYYGIYDPTQGTPEKVIQNFCTRALAFFEDVARALPHATAEDEKRVVYPQCENRKLVVSQLLRERSRLLAAECKIRDNYECQVCGLRFENLYGEFGDEFAEAHHLVPLSNLKPNVMTSLDDLATVCANCHRMLHRMAGKRDDIAKLKVIVRKRQGKRH